MRSARRVNAGGGAETGIFELKTADFLSGRAAQLS
jgi:hypothetical protein